MKVQAKDSAATLPEAALVGVDWGTTQRRVYALDGQGVLLRQHADADGALACKNRFPESLDAALEALQARPSTVVLSGMVGSALGWVPVPYLDGRVALRDLPAHLHVVPRAAGQPPALIVPGYCLRDAHGQPDVMRGEETQLLGALLLGHGDGWFVLPGTHSKWVQLQAGRVVALRTYMTGELFDLLGRHGTLAAAAGAEAAPWDDAAFQQGLESAQHGALGQQLFSVRARVVCGDMPAAHARAYLSGLLIGAELHDVLRHSGGAAGAQSICLIGTPALAQHYLAAAAPLQMRFEVLDAQRAYVRALAYFQTALGTP